MLVHECGRGLAKFSLTDYLYSNSVLIIDAFNLKFCSCCILKFHFDTGQCDTVIKGYGCVFHTLVFGRRTVKIRFSKLWICDVGMAHWKVEIRQIKKQ